MGDVDTLLITQGLEPMPLLLTLATLRPRRAVVVGHTHQLSEDTIGQALGGSKIDLVLWPLSDPRSPAAISARLSQLLIDTANGWLSGPFHLAYTGGTKAMSVETFRWWRQLRCASSDAWSATRAWYLDDRSRTIRPWPDGNPVSLSDDGLALATVASLHTGGFQLRLASPGGAAGSFFSRGDREVQTADRQALAARLGQVLGGVWHSVGMLKASGTESQAIDAMGLVSGRVVVATLVVKPERAERQPGSTFNPQEVVPGLKLAGFRALELARALGGDLARAVLVSQVATPDQCEAAAADLPDLGPADDRRVAFVTQSEAAGGDGWAGQLNLEGTPPPARGGESRGHAFGAVPSGRHLLATVGTNPLPVVHAIGTLRPERVTLLCSQATERLVLPITDATYAAYGERPRVDYLTLRDPADLISSLTASDGTLGVTDVAYTGGTKVMAVAAAAAHEAAKLWYVDDDQSWLRGAGTVEHPLRPPLGPISLEVMATLHSVSRLKSCSPRWTDTTGIPCARVPALVTQQQIYAAALDMEAQTARAVFDACQGEGLTASVHARKRGETHPPADPQLKPVLMRTLGLSSSVERDFEVDVCVIVGTQLTLFSCKTAWGTTASLLTYLAEARIRARQLGGDHAQAVLVVGYQAPQAAVNAALQGLGPAPRRHHILGFADHVLRPSDQLLAIITGAAR